MSIGAARAALGEPGSVSPGRWAGLWILEEAIDRALASSQGSPVAA